MNYQIKASSIANEDAVVQIKESNIDFGTTKGSEETLPNPAELFLGSLASCILKNVERFSGILKYTYSKATIEIKATRHESPPRMEDIIYDLTLYSEDKKIKVDLLKKNIERYGTIYNTVKLSSDISGTIRIIDPV
ncbi:OsmC family protein [Membranihabitans marinus]|uniref:OsmC family protein n=1 Tax=Membranihabitans marinus TaxID=1227546 RepID=UPI001F3A2AE6|nr:OsmC family protein [Membranihabitans marinus]